MSNDTPAENSDSEHTPGSHTSRRSLLAGVGALASAGTVQGFLDGDGGQRRARAEEDDETTTATETPTSTKTETETPTESKTETETTTNEEDDVDFLEDMSDWEFLGAVEDTVEDRVHEYKIRRDSLIQGADYIPEDELGTPRVTAGDTFYDGNYMVFRMEDIDGDTPHTFQTRGQTYVALTEDGYPVRSPDHDGEQEFGLAIHNNTTFYPGALETPETLYWHIKETAAHVCNREHYPDTPVEEVQLDTLKSELTALHEETDEEKETEKHEYIHSVLSDVEEASEFLYAEERHYKDVSALFDYTQLHSVFKSGEEISV